MKYISPMTLAILRQAAAFGDFQPASRFHGANVCQRMRKLQRLGFLELSVQVGRNHVTRNLYRLASRGREVVEANTHHAFDVPEPKPSPDRQLCTGRDCVLAATCGRVTPPRYFDHVSERMCPAGQTVHFVMSGNVPQDLTDPLKVSESPIPVRVIRSQWEWLGQHAKPTAPASVWELGAVA